MTTTSTSAEGFTFYATQEYFAELRRDIGATKMGDRILLATMAYDPRIQQIGDITRDLCAAAERGVDTKLSIDAYDLLVIGKSRPGPFFYHTELPNKLPRSLSHLTTAFQQLEKSGVQLTITNPPKQRFSMPFAGRSHAKISIINDVIYLGGCNLENQYLDCMARWQDAPTAQWLYDIFSRRFSQPQTQIALGATDLRHRISEAGEIIFDVGVKKQSAIYQEALDLIDRAQDWLVITCQFFPNSTTAKYLKAASDRGVQVFPIFNHYSQHKGAHRLLQEGVTRRERLRMPASFFAGQLSPTQTYLHAKILASKNEAMLSSHNFVTAGVNLGTAEIALHHKSAAFSAALAKLILDETGLTSTIEPKLFG